MIKLALHGATGRMGLTIARLCAESKDIEVVGAVSHPNDPLQGRDLGELAGVGNWGVAVGPDAEAGLLGADVAIDFSLPPALPAFLHAARKQKVAAVIGTTGLGPEAIAAIDTAAREIPVLWAQNMSLGVQVLAELVQQALRRLGSDFDAEILEIHHRRKVDAPSGTAKRLFEAVQSVRAESKALHARDGQVGARTNEETGVVAIRGGDVIGDHTVYLLGPGERIELTHRATNRDLFAHGALRGARWVVGKAPGRYTIADALG
ncbi:MAG TPA: 4-hydroxy-tetrahydrodipicolinate reductase [Polyangiaceae bacterium]|nr:4-hydroxy-tetrahydrodipicolinate reductase [Polyangiaceae bacterium]